MLDRLFQTIKPSRFYLQLLILGREMLNQLAPYTKGAPIAALWSVQALGCSTQQNTLSYYSCSNMTSLLFPLG